MSVDQATFRSVLGRFASGVTVMTVRDRDTDHGMTASAFCSLSLDPPLVLVCIDRTTRMHERLQSAEHFAVNLLAADQEMISRRFAEPPDDSRFEGVGFTRGTTGAPLLTDALAHLECELVKRYPGGDHTIIVGRVVGAAAAGDARPLLYYRGGYAELER
ncbi:MAG TPA: flavin reductase family protein [Gemmatimonadaceae bacterium]|nr:flavin reductase family protein [Gemmatimonadaceae bacterium]